MNIQTAYDIGASDMQIAWSHNVAPYLIRHGRGPLPEDLEKLLREAESRAETIYHTTSGATIQRYKDGIRETWDKLCSIWNKAHTTEGTS